MTENKETNKKVTIWTRGFTCVLIANICMGMAQFSVNTYVSTYMKYLGTGAVLTGLIAGLYFGVAFAMRPISGPAITLLNKRTLMIIVYSTNVFINLGYAFFPSVEMFVVMRCLHGVQLAFLGSLALTVASESLPESKMASGLGIYGLSNIVAQAFGPSLGVFVRGIGHNINGDAGGFMALFLTSSLFAAISVIPCILLPNKKVDKKDIASLGAWYKNIVAKEALLPSLVCMLMAMSMILFSTYLIPYGAWKNISNISIYFTVNAMVMVFTRPLAGRLTDKYGPQKIFYPSIILYILSFVFISSATNLTLIIIGATCASLGLGASMPAVQVMAIQSVPPLRRGVASNTNFLGLDLGSFLGPTLSGFVLANYDYVVMFRVAIIPIVLSMVVFTIGWKPYVRQREYLKQLAGDPGTRFLDPSSGSDN